VKYLYFCLMALSLMICGCSTANMKVSENQNIQKITSGQAQIVFTRSKFMGSAISASLYDVTSGSPKFVGIIANDTKILYKTSSGKKRFMVVAENADFMEANVIGGKTYRAVVTPRWGAMKARFSLWPVKKAATAEFHSGDPKTEALFNTKLVELTPEAIEWYNANKEDIQNKHNEYLIKWKKFTPENLALRTLNPGDGD
jgi:hypothetical protein